MEYQVRFGTLSSDRRPKTNNKTFRLAVLGDFSAQGNSGRVEVGEALAARKPLKVTHENIDDLLKRLDVHLNLPAGASGNLIDVPIRSLDDFHPDQLYGNIPLFEKLVSLRQKLRDPSSFDKAAAAVRSLSGNGEVPALAIRSASTQVPRGRIESFADLLGQQVKAQQPAELKSLLRDVVGPHVVPHMQDQSALIAAVDQALSDLMRRVLHHPDFQALEGLWRSLDLLVHRLELDHELEIVLYDISAAELAADLASSDQLDQTGLYRWLIEVPSLDATQGALSLLVTNFVFEQIPPHVDLLARLAKIASAAGAPVIAAVDAACVQKKSEDEHPLVKQAWESLRELPESVYLALASPRFMLRWPYGKKTEPIDAFAFEEFTAKSGLSGMLWGSSAFLAGLVIAQTWRDSGWKDMALGSLLTVDDMPFYYFQDRDGDQVALPCTERLVNVRSAERMTAQGIVPALSIQGRNEIRLGGLKSVHGAELAGPWAPVAIGTESVSATPAAAPTTAAPAEVTPPPAPAESSADAELDALLGSLDQMDSGASEAAPPAAEAAAPAAEPAPASEQDDLDNLLASLDAADEQKASQEGDVDAELASLLADL